MSGKGQSKLKLSGNGNECKPLPALRAHQVALLVVLDDDRLYLQLRQRAPRQGKSCEDIKSEKEGEVEM